MNYFLLLFLIFGVLSGTWSDDLIEDNGQTLPLALIPTEEKESNADDEVIITELSSLALSGIYELAKNISHFKGLFQQVLNETGVERTLRRSISRKISVASHSETVKEILQQLDSKDDLKIELLEKLENLIHEYDVAVNFANMGGLKIVMPYLYSPNDKLASLAALVLGSAMQSNPTVKKLAMNENIGKILLEQLSHKSNDVLPRIIYALSSFLRNCPEAQEEFLSSEGVSKFADIFTNRFVITDVKLKIVNLLNDLAAEQETPEQDQKEGNTEKISALQRLFADEIEKNEICLHVAFFLSFEDYDTHQKTVAAMLSLDKICHEDFDHGRIINRLEKLLKIYQPGPSVPIPVYKYLDPDLKYALYQEIRGLFFKFRSNVTSSTDSFNHSLKWEL